MHSQALAHAGHPVTFIEQAATADVIGRQGLKIHRGTVTTAVQPLFDAEWLQPGTHINAAGSNALIRQELSEATLRRCALIAVDAVPTALAEAGDLLPLLEKGRLHTRQLVELGDILTGKHAGRTSAEQITVFESQGMAIQDLAVALRVVAAARERGLGVELPLQ